MPDELCALLLDKENLGEDDLSRVNGPVNLHRMAAVHDHVARPDLKFKPFEKSLEGRRRAAHPLPLNVQLITLGPLTILLGRVQVVKGPYVIC